ncbi:MAG: hypothetical protein KBC64_06470 [Simkaniaceae bacterium]|nr:hypothetical protein [Simkaniaceae bacterium]
MLWKEIEQIFNRAIRYSFSRRKMLFLFPILAVCGLLVVFCRALGVGASEWVSLSLTFLPIFLCSSILLATGVVLARVYYQEVKQLKVSYLAIVSQTWELLIGVSYLTMPLILAYLMLWMMMGVFYLLREIPGLGQFLHVILAFGPFLLVLGSLILTGINLLLLFFVTPHVAFSTAPRFKLAEEVIQRLSAYPLMNILLFLIAAIPLAFVAGLLTLAASLTGASFLMGTHTLAVAMQWFFIMIPFSALLAPGLVFFFNFSVESYVILYKKVIASK